MLLYNYIEYFNPKIFFEYYWPLTLTLGHLLKYLNKYKILLLMYVCISMYTLVRIHTGIRGHIRAIDNSTDQ